MQLYYSKGACSLSPHIVLCEAGMNFDLVEVKLDTKTTSTGEDYLKVNPKGYVPALKLDDGTVITEGPAIVQYVADQVPQKQLAPANGTLARTRVQEWLNFITSELHKTYSPLFSQTAHEAQKEAARNTLSKRLPIVEAQLAKTPYITGAAFCVADAYLFTVLSWSKWVKYDLTPYPAIEAFLARMAERPAVQAALRAEHLMH